MAIPIIIFILITATIYADYCAGPIKNGAEPSDLLDEVCQKYQLCAYRAEMHEIHCCRAQMAIQLMLIDEMIDVRREILRRKLLMSSFNSTTICGAFDHLSAAATTVTVAAKFDTSRGMNYYTIHTSRNTSGAAYDLWAPVSDAWLIIPLTINDNYTYLAREAARGNDLWHKIDAAHQLAQDGETISADKIVMVNNRPFREKMYIYDASAREYHTCATERGILRKDLSAATAIARDSVADLRTRGIICIALIISLTTMFAIYMYYAIRIVRDGIKKRITGTIPLLLERMNKGVTS